MFVNIQMSGFPPVIGPFMKVRENTHTHCDPQSRTLLKPRDMYPLLLSRPMRTRNLSSSPQGLSELSIYRLGCISLYIPALIVSTSAPLALAELAPQNKKLLLYKSKSPPKDSLTPPCVGVRSSGALFLRPPCLTTTNAWLTWRA